MSVELLLGLLMLSESAVDFDAVEVASRVPNAPEVWTDGSLVYTSRSISGRAAGGVMLIMSNLIMWYSLVGGLLLFPGLCRLFSELNCGV